MKRSCIGWIHQLTFMPRVFPVNCYLVEEEELALVDAALPHSAPAILETARLIGKPITRILITHAHADHIGSLEALRRALPTAAVHISARDARLLAADRSLDSQEPATPIRGGVPKRPLQEPDILLAEGDRVGSLVGLAAPGHTPGSFAFWDLRTGALIAGDAFQTRGGIAVSGQLRPLFPFPAWATWNGQVALESARRLLRRGPSLLAVGHGPMVENPSPWMKEAIIQAEQRLHGRGRRV